jgi:hypothetical protein
MVQVKSEAEKLFFEEVREKKRTASGVHHKTGKNGYVGNMRFPSDIMNRKDKMKHRRASKVMTTNIFDTIIPIEEFEQLEKHEQRNRLQYWRTEKQGQEIMRGLKISSKRYYDLVASLDLPKAPRGKQKRKAKSIASAPQPKRETSVAVKEVESPNVPEVQEEKQVVQEVIVNGLNVIFNGTYSAEKIEKQLTKFMLLLDGEEEDFYIELKLMQKQPTK